METMEILSQKVNLSVNDILVISDIVDAFPKNSILANTCLIEKQFRNNIQKGHYLALAFLMGVCRATHEVCAMYQKQFEPCQRVN
jgi:hypothetical protein